MVIENSSRTTAHGVSANDWRLLLRTIRSLVVCEETLRLYPDGHQRIRQTIKSALHRIQEYHATTRHVFTVVPDLALDVAEMENSRDAKDAVTVAKQLRDHVIQRLAIHPEVDCDALEGLLRYLQSPGSDSGGPSVAGGAPQWPHIEIELFRDGEEGEGYRFNAQGEQLVQTRAEASSSLSALPPSLRQNLARIFAEPEIRESIDRLESRLGAETPNEGAGTGAAGGRVDLVGEIVGVLFEKSGAVVDVPHDVLTAKLHDFLRFLEGLAPALPGSGEEAQRLSQKDVRELVARAVGLQYREQAGVAEIFRHSDRLKALLSGTDSFRLRGEAGGSSAVARRPVSERESGETKKSRLRLKNNDPSSQRAAGGSPATCPEAARPPEDDRTPPSPDAETPRISPEFSSRRAVELYREKVAEDFKSFDYDLEALRIRTELLSLERSQEAYDEKRERLLERFGSRSWPSAESFNEELDSTVEALATAEGDGGVRLTARALASQGSQEVVDRFFSRRVENGASIDSLRPVIRELAADDVARPAGALTSLWKKGERRTRDTYIDEIFGLFNAASTPDKLAAWGRNHVTAFSSPRSLSHLRSLTPRAVEKIFREVSAPGGDARAGSVQAAVTVVDAIGGDPEHEPVLIMALRRGSPVVQKRALTTLQSCSTRDMLDELTKIIEKENEKEQPDLDQVHLALSALVKSRLPYARDRLRRFRSERRRLRHVYRSDIRKILDLLCKMDGVTL